MKLLAEKMAAVDFQTAILHVQGEEDRFCSFLHLILQKDKQQGDDD